jgi:hypothetical protein
MIVWSLVWMRIIRRLDYPADNEDEKAAVLLSLTYSSFYFAPANQISDNPRPQKNDFS